MPWPCQHPAQVVRVDAVERLKRIFDARPPQLHSTSKHHSTHDAGYADHNSGSTRWLYGTTLLIPCAEQEKLPNKTAQQPEKKSRQIKRTQRAGEGNIQANVCVFTKNARSVTCRARVQSNQHGPLIGQKTCVSIVDMRYAVQCVALGPRVLNQAGGVTLRSTKFLADVRTQTRGHKI